MGTVTFNGETLHTSGDLPAVGTRAADFTVTKTDLGEVHLKHFLGKKIVLNIFPSLDTDTCARAMIQFNKIAAQYPELLILCISADLPFAQQRFCTAKHLNNVLTASTFRHPDFGQNYGVTIVEGPLEGLLARSVVIINEHGKVIYTQQVEELTKEPDYQAIVDALGNT